MGTSHQRRRRWCKEIVRCAQGASAKPAMPGCVGPGSARDQAAPCRQAMARPCQIPLHNDTLGVPPACRRRARPRRSQVHDDSSATRPGASSGTGARRRPNLRPARRRAQRRRSGDRRGDGPLAASDRAAPWHRARESAAASVYTCKHWARSHPPQRRLPRNSVAEHRSIVAGWLGVVCRSALSDLQPTKSRDAYFNASIRTVLPLIRSRPSAATLAAIALPMAT